MNETTKNNPSSEENKTISTKEKKPFNYKPIIFLLLAATIGFLYTAGFYGWITIPVNSGVLIASLAMSIVLNVLILATVFVLPIGKKVLMRFQQRMNYKKGQHVNALYITKNGVITEVYKKKNDDGTLKIDKKSYTRNPTLLFNYEGIPTYLFIEDHADPLNVWSEKYAAEMSCAEIDEVMNSTGAFDLKQWLEQNKTILVMSLLIMIGACAISAYFGYSAFQMLRDGTYSAVKGVTAVTAGIN